MSTWNVEILAFEGCPNRGRAIELVSRVVAEIGVEAMIEVVDVADGEQAQRLRFLGSPSIRVDGQDIQAGADERNDFAMACRVYTTDTGMKGLPDERWLAEALTRTQPPR